MDKTFNVRSLIDLGSFKRRLQRWNFLHKFLQTLLPPYDIHWEKLYLVKKLYLSNSISSYFLASRSRTRVREFGRELSYKGDVMVRQRFTALCSTAMVSSIMDSPSNLYKVLTVSTEFVTNFWKWSQYSTDHQKCVVIFFLKIFGQGYWTHNILTFQCQIYLNLFKKNIFHWIISGAFGKNIFW